MVFVIAVICSSIVSLHTVTFDVTIITLPAAIGSNYTNAYFTGTDLTLTCMVTPTPPFDSEFYWNCSSGCFADMEMEQIIQVTDLEETDSGVLSCSVLINGIQYVSESVELVIVEGTYKVFVLCENTLHSAVIMPKT